MASLTRWTWVWVNSGSWWWTGRPGVLWFMGSRRVGHDWATELNWTDELHIPSFSSRFLELFLWIFVRSILKWRAEHCLAPRFLPCSSPHAYLEVLPRWHSGKKSTCQCRRFKRHGFDPWVGKMPWSRKWQPTPLFLPGKSHGQRSLADYSPGRCRVRHDWATEYTHVHIPWGRTVESCRVWAVKFFLIFPNSSSK